MFDDDLRTRLIILGYEEAPAGDTDYVYGDGLVPPQVSGGQGSESTNIYGSSVLAYFSAGGASDTSSAGYGLALAWMMGGAEAPTSTSASGDSIAAGIGGSEFEQGEGTSGDGAVSGPLGEGFADEAVLIRAYGDGLVPRSPGEGLAVEAATSFGDFFAWPDIRESHFIVFNGTSQYAFAKNAFSGLSTDGWSLILKVVERLPVAGGSGSKRYARLYDNNANALLAEVDVLYQGTAGGNEAKVFAAGFKSTGGVNYAFELNETTVHGEQVIAISHRNIATLRADQYLTKDGATLAKTGANFGSPEARQPLHIAIGVQLNNADAPVGSTYGAVRLIAAVVVNGEITEAEAQAYSTTRNAFHVFGSRVHSYWTAARAVGNRIPNEVRGGADLSLVNITGSEKIPMRLPGPLGAGGWSEFGFALGDAIEGSIGAGALPEDAGAFGYGVSRSDSLGHASEMSSEYGDGAVGRLPGDGISSSSHAGHGDAQNPADGAGQAHAATAAEALGISAAPADGIFSELGSAVGDGNTASPIGDGLSDFSSGLYGDAQIPLHGEGEAAEGISILTDATSPPWPGEGFVDILQSLGVYVFGDAIVAPGAEGFVEFGNIAAYGDARWAAWVAAGFIYQTIYPTCLSVTADGDDATFATYDGDDATEAAFDGDDMTSALPDKC